MITEFFRSIAAAMADPETYGTGNPYDLYQLDPNLSMLLYLFASLLFGTGVFFLLRSLVQDGAQGGRTAGATLILLAFLVAGPVFYINSEFRHIPFVFSEQLMLEHLWSDYKETYWDAETGRTIDPSHELGDVTTSEGQSYTLLRAVWMDDKETFDRTLAWTNDHLRRRDDALFAWLYGPRSAGGEGIILEQGGVNTASDANTDIALALIFAYSRWQERPYLEQALETLQDIWILEVAMIQGRPYLSAHDIRPQEPFIVVNPSYLAPYAYRIFAEIDPSNDWEALVDTSYDLLERSMTEPLDGSETVGLPPDWMEIDKQTGEIAPSREPHLTTEFGHEAMRVPLRLALDALWNEDPRAEETLERMEFLHEEWQDRGKLMTTYARDGSVIGAYEQMAMYGGVIGYFLIIHPEVAQEIYTQKLKFLYDPAQEGWKYPLSYYDDNLAWFGIALVNGKLIDLYELDNTP